MARRHAENTARAEDLSELRARGWGGGQPLHRPSMKATLEQIRHDYEDNGRIIKNLGLK